MFCFTFFNNPWVLYITFVSSYVVCCWVPLSNLCLSFHHFVGSVNASAICWVFAVLTYLLIFPSVRSFVHSLPSRDLPFLPLTLSLITSHWYSVCQIVTLYLFVTFSDILTYTVCFLYYPSIYYFTLVLFFTSCGTPRSYLYDLNLQVQQSVCKYTACEKIITHNKKTNYLEDNWRSVSCLPPLPTKLPSVNKWNQWNIEVMIFLPPPFF